MNKVMKKREKKKKKKEKKRPKMMQNQRMNGRYVVQLGNSPQSQGPTGNLSSPAVCQRLACRFSLNLSSSIDFPHHCFRAHSIPFRHIVVPSRCEGGSRATDSRSQVSKRQSCSWHTHTRSTHTHTHTHTPHPRLGLPLSSKSATPTKPHKTGPANEGHSYMEKNSEREVRGKGKSRTKEKKVATYPYRSPSMDHDQTVLQQAKQQPDSRRSISSTDSPVSNADYSFLGSGG